MSVATFSFVVAIYQLNNANSIEDKYGYKL